MMTAPLRVLLVTGEYPPDIGGVGDYTALLAASLRALDVEVTIVAGRSASAPDVIALRSWGPSSLVAIARIAVARRADIVHIQYQSGAYGMRPSINVAPAFLRASRRIPVVTTFHDLLPPYIAPKAGPLRDRAVDLMARASSVAIVTNLDDARALQRRGIANERIPIGPNIPPTQPTAHPVERVVAFFGLPTKSKGVLRLIDAVGRIDESLRPPIVVIGPRGSPSAMNDVVPMEVMERMARFRRVELRVTGFLAPPEAAAALARSGVIAAPFVAGATLRSGSLLAALASGRPVVATAPEDRGTLDGIAGLRQLRLVPANDPEAFAEALMSALDTPVQADPLPTECTWTSIAERHLAVYTRLCAGHAR